MDIPSEDWVYNDLDDYDTAAPPLIQGDLTLGVYAQLNWRFRTQRGLLFPELFLLR